MCCLTKAGLTPLATSRYKFKINDFAIEREALQLRLATREVTENEKYVSAGQSK
jgi:hypothetical protein